VSLILFPLQHISCKVLQFTNSFLHEANPTTAVSAPGPATTTPATTQSTTPSTVTSGDGENGPGLSRGDKITLGTAIGIGIPGLIIALWQLCL
jgi:hypothetical protein